MRAAEAWTDICNSKLKSQNFYIVLVLFSEKTAIVFLVSLNEICSWLISNAASYSKDLGFKSRPSILQSR